MQNELRKRMSQGGYSDSTIKQREQDLVKYFGSNKSYSTAYQKLMGVEEIHKRSNHANKVASILELMPELRPSKKKYDEFKKLQKEWNKTKNEYYKNKSSNTVTKQNVKEFERKCDSLQKESSESIKKLRKYVLCQLYVLLPVHILRSFEMRTLKVKKEGNSRKQNYITKNRIVIGDNKLGKSESFNLPQKLQDVIDELRKQSKGIYLFGGDKPLSQPAYSIMQSKELGYTNKQLRDLKQFQT